jgi:GNAT superfamily N-acetyltransferase
MTSSALTIRTLRKLDLSDMGEAARIHRTAFDQALPWLVGLHTPDEDRAFYRKHVFETCTLWGAFEHGSMTGLIAFHDDWIDQLYVLPQTHGRGTGSELLAVAKRRSDRLQLWTFQRNTGARRFCEARGFVLVEQTDGSRNEEKEPDSRYLWARAAGG